MSCYNFNWINFLIETKMMYGKNVEWKVFHQEKDALKRDVAGYGREGNDKPKCINFTTIIEFEIIYCPKQNYMKSVAYYYVYLLSVGISMPNRKSTVRELL